MHRRRLRIAALMVFVVVLGAAVATSVVLIRAAATRQPPVPGPGASQPVSGIPPLQNVIQDQGNTVALPDGRTLWIFADTANLHAEPRFFVTSSAGIASGSQLRLTYLTDRAGTPIEFLPRTPLERANQQAGVSYTAIWPTGATTLPDGRILIAYAKYAVHLKPTPDFIFLAGGLFTYSYPGRQIIGDGASAGQPPASSGQAATRLADDIWTPADGPIASPVYSGGYVYFARCEDYRCYSVRTTPAGLADRTSYRWWTGFDWSPLRSQRARVTFGSDVPGRNPSIAWSPALGVFTMADTSGGIQSGQGLFWVARHPWGPWSNAAPYPLPQCPRDGCYTLNVHPLQSPPGSLRVSFATNGVGPFVRVVDVPVRVQTTGKIPTITTHPAPKTP